MSRIFSTGLFFLLLVLCGGLAEQEQPTWSFAAIQPTSLENAIAGASSTTKQPDLTEISPQFDSASNFSEGLALVGFEQTYGFIDKTGRVVVKPAIEFSGMAPFSEGLAIVRLGSVYGCIDRKGQLLPNVQYDQISPFSEGLATVRLGHQSCAWVTSMDTSTAPAHW